MKFLNRTSYIRPKNVPAKNKRILTLSGTWLNHCAWLDGDKLVCMDLLKDAIDKGECLIYSFGLGSDWTFEHMFADMGCTVRAFDPTVIQEPENIHANIHFKQFGISNISGLSEVYVQPFLKNFNQFCS